MRFVDLWKGCISMFIWNDLVSVFDGDFSFYITSADGELNVGYQEDLVLKVASVGKLFILGAFLEACQKGKLSLSDTVIVKADDMVEGSGVLQYLEPDHSFSLKELATYMIIVSDNMATNLVLRELGGAAIVKEHLQRLGITRSGVNRRIAMTEEDMRMGCFAQATTKDLVSYLKQMERGDVLNESYRTLFHQILEKQQFKNMFLRKLPLADHYDSEKEALVMLHAGSKTGYDGDQRADTGWILFPGGEMIFYACIANNGTDQRYATDNEAECLMAALGERFWEAYQKEE